jgi:AN1-like Zinc finger
MCPLCGVGVELPAPTASADVAVNRHMESSECGKKRVKRHSKCAHKRCTVRNAVPAVCEYCEMEYCMHHRHAIDHGCEKLKQTKVRRLRRSQETSSDDAAKVSAENRARRRERLNRLIEDSANRGSDGARRVVNMRRRRGAVGDESIDVDARVYVEVVYPQHACLPPRVHFFAGKTSVGRALDDICDAARIANRNHRPGFDRLCLYDLRTGEKLATSTRMSAIDNYAPVLLEFESVNG